MDAEGLTYMPIGGENVLAIQLSDTSDCGGKDSLYDINKSISLLARLSRKIRVIGVIVDSESLSVEDRVRSIMDSLKVNFKIDPLEEICCNTY